MQFISRNQRPVHIYGTKNKQTSLGATEFLRANDGIAGLLPTAMRMASLQQDCAAALPAMFSNCDVLSYQDAVLVLAVPSSAIAARLKQQLPKLQASLLARGWQVESARVKVQVTRAFAPEPPRPNRELPPNAVKAFEELGEALPETAQNAQLIAAIRSLAAKRRGEF
jgi:Dna[CI] antecedent, DciA